MTGLIFHLNEWKGLCYDSPDALSIFAPQMEQSWHFIMICRPPGSPPKHSGCMLGLWQDDCLSRVAAELMFLLRHWVNRLIHANMKKLKTSARASTGWDVPLMWLLRFINSVLTTGLRVCRINILRWDFRKGVWTFAGVVTLMQIQSFNRINASETFTVRWCSRLSMCSIKGWKSIRKGLITSPGFLFAAHLEPP